MVLRKVVVAAKRLKTGETGRETGLSRRNDMKLLTFLCLLLLPLYLGGEFIICNETGIQYEPEIGFDGTNFFVIWSDERGSASSIYGTRVTQSGIILDPGGFKLLHENDCQSHPSVAYDGMNYLVVLKFGG